MTAPRYFPRKPDPRQGKRKRDRWGLCKECGCPTRFRCASCGFWRCDLHFRLRAAPGRVGHYIGRCLPGCRKRMAPDVAARLRGELQELEAELSDDEPPDGEAF